MVCEFQFALKDMLNVSLCKISFDMACMYVEKYNECLLILMYHYRFMQKKSGNNVLYAMSNMRRRLAGIMCSGERKHSRQITL